VHGIDAANQNDVAERRSGRWRIDGERRSLSASLIPQGIEDDGLQRIDTRLGREMVLHRDGLVRILPQDVGTFMEGEIFAEVP
jgi:hypothetical protein